MTTEFDLIKRVIAFQKKKLPSGLIGAGDDCAVIPCSWIGQDSSKTTILLTTDSMVEDKDFRMQYTPPYELGWKLLAINLSDIAAMGGEPRVALVTLQLRPEIDLNFIDELYKGIYACAEKYNVLIVGGDTSSAGEISLGITLLGSCQKNPLLRSSAKIGDDIWISGSLGGASYALDVLEGKISTFEKHQFEEARKKLFAPEPRVQLGKILSEEALANAAIDISDGLLQDLMHITSASNVAIEIEFQEIPASIELGHKKYALCGGEDFEIAFTAAPENRKKILALCISDGQKSERNLNLIRIGQVIDKSKSNQESILIRSKDGNLSGWQEFLTEKGIFTPPGFQHFGTIR